jgi:hypothetical protein
MSKWNAILIPAGIDSDGVGLKLCGLGGGKSGLLLSAGSSSRKAATSKANVNFLSFYFDSQATSGDNRGLYLRTYFSGIGGGGDAARVFATVDAVGAGTVHGLHASVNFAAATDKVTGQAAAIRATWHIPNGAMPANGTYSALIAEVYADGNSASPAAVTQHSIARFVVAGGNATARDKVKNLFTIEGVSSASGNMIHTGQNEPTWTGATALIRILINGTAYHLIAVAA